MKRIIFLLAALAALLVMLWMPVSAAADYVDDGAEILTDSEEQALEQLAGEVSEKIGSDVYIVTIWDHRADDGAVSVRAWAEQYFTDHDLGRGAQKEGILLLLSMRERDYALIFHGGETIRTFTDSRQENLEDAFLDNFREDDWFGGLSDYLEGCRHEEKLSRTAPVLIVLLVPLAVAAVACAVMAAMMKTARAKTHADYYIPGGGVSVTHSTDRFLNRTVVRHKIETGSSGGGSRSGGFSGRSGKF